MWMALVWESRILWDKAVYAFIQYAINWSCLCKVQAVARYFPRKIYTFPWARNFMSIASTSDRAMQVIGSSKLH